MLKDYQMEGELITRSLKAMDYRVRQKAWLQMQNFEKKIRVLPNVWSICIAKSIP